ncbi:hypothetical protein [Paraburkholderia sp. SIMBA_054]|uniref:hypothetical protein n=1 Tax=Paraburkholderia TaxID=1822464 RepID=UPI003978DCD3
MKQANVSRMPAKSHNADAGAKTKTPTGSIYTQKAKIGCQRKAKKTKPDASAKTKQTTQRRRQQKNLKPQPLGYPH